MKAIHCIAIVIGLIALSACNQDEYLENLSKPQEESSFTRSLAPESASLITPLEIDSAWIEAVKSHLTKNRPAFSSVSPVEPTEIDNNFYSNIWNIRDMPITIQARIPGYNSGSYLSSNGLGKEITLFESGDQKQQKFYLKILPASSGIPYLIYSIETNTPLSVGQYSNNPDNKILFARSDNSGTSISSSWDLIPSQSYKGYFAIESQSYFGQSDPDNMWSVFNYVLEAKDNNKLGYGKYTKKAQQEFSITPDASFVIDEVNLIDGTEQITPGKEITINAEGINRSIEPQPFSLTIDTVDYETSKFTEHAGAIKFRKTANKTFKRPTIIAGRISYLDNWQDATYPTKPALPQKIKKPLKYNIEGYAPERCKIEVMSQISTYNVSMNYIAKAHYTFNGEQREMLISGTWNALLIESPINKAP